MSSTKTEGVLVSVRSAYVKEQSSPHLEHFVFAYKVRIVNESAHTVQLIGRKWLISDATGRKRMVTGEGVIGQQPILAPGESHEYISGCDFPTPIGQMHGFYFMERQVDGAELKVRIPRFTMVVPYLLN
ncbi:MAG: Co2+/Mg2+ efflux protein ApaG [Bacteroidota bacterium]